MEHFEKTFTGTDATRLDKFLSEQMSGIMSRAQIKALIERGGVTVDGALATMASRLLRPGQTAVVTYGMNTGAKALSKADIPLKVVYEDDYLMVVDKPNGLVVHPGAGNKDGTLANALYNYLSEEVDERSGLVHRIDRQTTGLLLVAKDKQTLEQLSQQMKSRTIARKYAGVVKGVISEKTGTIAAPIGRSRANRLKMAVTAYNSRPAVTHFRVLRTGTSWTAVECSLDTGRTHQIRVHMAYIRHPLLGDVTYGGPPLPDDYGQLLHAYSLSFVHPRTKKRIAVRSPLPPEFAPYVTDRDLQG